MQGFAVLEQVFHGAHFVEPSPAPSLAKMQALKTTCVVLESTTTSKVQRRRRISSGLQTVQTPDSKQSPFGLPKIRAKQRCVDYALAKTTEEEEFYQLRPAKKV